MYGVVRGLGDSGLRFMCLAFGVSRQFINNLRRFPSLRVRGGFSMRSQFRFSVIDIC